MAEVTALRNNATIFPVYGLPYNLVIPILDADGDPVTGATGLDTEISLNGDTPTDATNEATEIGTSGCYYISLTAAEMTTDILSGVTKTSSSGAKTTPWVLYPRKLSVLLTADNAGAYDSTTTINLGAGASPIDNFYIGCIVYIYGGTGNGQVRMITGYVGSTKIATVHVAWATNPDATSDLKIYRTEQAPYVMDANITKISGTAQTARDIGANVLLSPGTGTGQLLLSSGLVDVTQTAADKVWGTTVRALTDKAGFLLAATGADLILKSSTFIQAIVAAINELTTYGLTALNTLLVTTGIKAASIPDVTLAASQGSYAPAKAGDKMDLIDAPNATAVGVIQSGLATLSKLLKYFQLLFRKDAAIKSDNSTEFTAINANGGSGAGTFDNVTDSIEALRDDIPVLVEQHIINETDGEAVLAAIVAKIADLDPSLGELTLAAIGDAVRAELATELAHLNADITSRSSHSAADVWAVTARTLTAFGFTVSINSNGDITAIKGVSDKVDTALVADGLVYKFTENALEEAPSGSGLDAAGVRTALGMAEPNFDDQITGTNELIQAIPDSMEGLATTEDVTGATDYIDTQILSIKEKTDNLPTSPAAVGDPMILSGDFTSTMKASISGAVPTVAAIATGIWNYLLTAMLTAGSIGKAMADWLVARVPGSTAFTATDVAIANNALRLLGNNPIVAFTDSTKAANLCLQFYQQTVNATLRAFTWNCATTRSGALEAAETPSFGYGFAFELPTGCLRVLNISDDQSIKFKIESGLILTDSNDCKISYINQITPDYMDALLIEAISARLAATIAFTLTNSVTAADAMWKLYKDKLDEAQTTDSFEGSSEQMASDDWINSRR